MAAQTFSCPECDHKLRANNPIAPGKKVRCPRCQAVFPVPASAANSAATGIKKPAVTARARDLDDENEDMPVKKRRVEQVAPARKVKPPPRDEDIDDEEEQEEEEEERPRKKKKKKSSSQMPLILGLSGGAALLLIFVVTAFLWPGFLVGKESPKGPQPVPGGPAAVDAARAPEGPDNVLAYLPADSVVLGGSHVAAWRAAPTFAKDLQQLRGLLAMQGAPPEIADLVPDLDRVAFAMLGKQQPQFVAALSTKTPYEVEKIKKIFQAGASETVAGRDVYRLTADPSMVLAMPNQRVIVLSNMSEQELAGVLSSRQVNLDKDVQQQVTKLQSSMMWGLALNRGPIQEGLLKLAPADLRLAAPGAENLIPPLQKAKAAFATVDMPGKSLVLKAGLVCADIKDAQFVAGQVQGLWNGKGKELLQGARQMFAFQKELAPLSDLINDVERTFKVTHQGTEVTASMQLSEKAIQSLESMQQLIPGAGFNPGAPVPPGRPPLPPGKRKR